MKEPTLDQWTTGFGLVAFLGLFVAPLLYSQAGQRKAQVGYVVAMVLFSLVLLYYVLWWSRYLQYFPYLSGTVDQFTLLFGPLFYLYLRSLAGQPVPLRQQRLHFVPFVVCLLVSLPWAMLPIVERRALLQAGTPGGYFGFYLHVVPWLALGHLLLYAVAIWRLLPAFSTLQHIRRWAQWLAVCYFGFVLAHWTYYLLVQLPFFNRAWDYGISLSMAAFIFLVAVLAYVQPQVFQTNQAPSFAPAPKPTAPVQAVAEEPAAPEMPTDVFPTARYQHSGLPPQLAAQQAQRLEQLMRTEKLYRQSELRLDTLADKLEMSRHHLSQVLNEGLGMNFFEYIKSLRVAEAKDLLCSTSRRQLNIIEVAYEVGFNNKVSFNKAFKAATGLTPSEFRQAHNGNPDRDLPLEVYPGLEKG
jgi:AraC-like DNA-binding protein